MASGVAGEVLAAPAWDEEDGEDVDLEADDMPDDASGPEPDPDDTIRFHAPAELLPEQRHSPARGPGGSRGPTPVRDTTPPAGVARAQRTPASDELDLAGLVASVDEDAPGPPSDQRVDVPPSSPENGSSEAPRQ